MVEAEPVRALVAVQRPFWGCAVVTLDRPEALNALSSAMRRELARTFEALAKDGQTRVAVFTGSGRAFCAGLDLRELAQAPDPAELVVQRRS